MSKLFVDEIVHQSSQGSGTITIGASGETISVPNGSLTGQNYPAFEARLSANQYGVADAVNTKVQYNTENFDTNSSFILKEEQINLSAFLYSFLYRNIITIL